MPYVVSADYLDGNLDAVREMLVHPNTIPGLSDGGAHVGTICDGSFPTTLLAHWTRDRVGERSRWSTSSSSSPGTPRGPWG
jgi:N-acyl-D-aspartate/D-glutamate deacylase